MSAAAGSPEELLTSYKDTIDKAEKFLTLLQEFCDMGTAMRTVITRCLVNSSHYQLLTEQILSESITKELQSETHNRSGESDDIITIILPVVIST